MMTTRQFNKNFNVVRSHLFSLKSMTYPFPGKKSPKILALYVENYVTFLHVFSNLRRQTCTYILSLKNVGLSINEQPDSATKNSNTRR